MGTAILSPADPFDAGPYAKVLARLRLGEIGAKPQGANITARRAVAFVSVAWVPLVILAAIQGFAIGPTPHESLLMDLAAYGRYVVAMPLLIVAEAMCVPKLAAIAHEFVENGLVPSEQRPRFDALIASTRRMLERRWVGVLVAALAYGVALASAPIIYPRAVSSWVAPIGPEGRIISLAGWWRLIVSQPLFLMLLFVWLWRIALWTRFLWKVSGMSLGIVPSHPDGAGGLKFLTVSFRGMRWFAAALGAATAGTVAQGIFLDDRPIKSFEPTIAILVVMVIVLVAGPLTVFFRPLVKARSRGIFAYGALASAMGREFQRQWLSEDTKVDAEALSRQDFSATTDLFSIAANAHSMKTIPFELPSLLPVVYAALIPFLPVVLAILPMKQLLSYAAKLLL